MNSLRGNTTDYINLAPPVAYRRTALSHVSSINRMDTKNVQRSVIIIIISSSSSSRLVVVTAVPVIMH